MEIPPNSEMCGNLAGCKRSTEQGPKKPLVVMLGLLDGDPHRERAMSEAGSLVHPVEFACGVSEESVSQGARRAARPRRDPLWDEAMVEETGVHSPCGSTLGKEPPSGCGGKVGIACGGSGMTVALQETRWAVKPHRAILWENARQAGREKTAGMALAVAMGAIVPCCASRLSNLTKVLRRVP